MILNFYKIYNIFYFIRFYPVRTFLPARSYNNKNPSLEENPVKRGLFIIIPLLLILLCRFLYPYTRFGYCKKLILPSEKHLNIHTATLKPGEKIKLKLVGIRKIARFSSSDFRVASVTSSGTVYALAPGTAIISVKQDSKTYKCKITVVSK